jgi:hypothetical protein
MDTALEGLAQHLSENLPLGLIEPRQQQVHGPLIRHRFRLRVSVGVPQSGASTPGPNLTLPIAAGANQTVDHLAVHPIAVVHTVHTAVLTISLGEPLGDDGRPANDPGLGHAAVDRW